MRQSDGKDIRFEAGLLANKNPAEPVNARRGVVEYQCEQQRASYAAIHGVHVVPLMLVMDQLSGC
jgi:hypothetical protein